MATYSVEKLAEITALAAVFFTPKEIAVIIEVDTAVLVADCDEVDSPAYKAYYSGFYKREKELREKIIQLSNQGSSPAQTAELDMIRNAKLKMLER